MIIPPDRSSGWPASRPPHRLRKSFLVAVAASALILFLAAIGALSLYAVPALRSLLGDWMPHGALIVEPAAKAAIEHSVGEFRIAWQPDERTHGPRLAITHRAEPDHLAFFTTIGEPFVLAASGHESTGPAEGSVSIYDRRAERCTTQHVDRLETEPDALTVRGRLDCAGGRSVGYRLRFSARSASALGFELQLEEGSRYNRVILRAATLRAERIYGLGEQLSHFELKGRKVPIWIGAPGLGRGAQPVTLLADLLARAGGSWHATAAAVPHYLTSEQRSLALDNREYQVFDLSEEHRIQITVYGQGLRGRIFAGASPAEQIREYTAETGRMRPLPYWVHRGAIVGVAGGTARVRATYRALLAAQVPVAALWLQDADGPPSAPAGFGPPPHPRLLLDRTRYPDWEALVAELHKDDVRLLTTVSPYLEDASAQGSPPPTRDLHREAVGQRFLVRLATGAGEPARFRRGDRVYGLVDLFEPKARAWFKEVLEKEVLDLGFDGWLATGGEDLPATGLWIPPGDTGARAHHRFPEEWARLQREVLDGHADRPGEKLFAIQAGYTNSPRHATLFWLGDQLATWDEHDGIKSAVTGMLSAGLSGYALTHGDLGGGRTLRSPLKDYRRSEELLLRWMELAALTPVFRSHRGSSGLVDDGDQQVDSSPRTLAALARAARLYRAWAGYRMRLIAEAAQTGLPVVRPLFLHYPSDPQVLGLDRQFLVGQELLVAPVLEPEKTSVPVYLPAGEWVHLWTGTRHGVAAGGKWLTVSAPLGQPAIFYRGGSLVGAELIRELQQEGLLPAAR